MSQEFTRQNEGYSELIYIDSLGHATVGWGTHLYPGRYVPRFILEHLFRADYQQAANEVDLRFPALSLVRRDALIDMMYNLGPRRFDGFRNMIDAIHNDDWDTAAHEALCSLWAKQVKSRATKIAYMLRFDRYMPGSR